MTSRQIGGLTETVEVKSVQGVSETQAGREPRRRREVLSGPSVHRRRRAPGRIGAAHAARLPADAAERRPDVPRSQFNSRINGGQAMATENFFDGAAFGYASGHQQSHESTPPLEAVQEVKVISTTYSAQYGHTRAASLILSKSGTNVSAAAC